MDCSPPGSSVHGILQAIILEGVAKRALKKKNEENLNKEGERQLKKEEGKGKQKERKKEKKQ